MSPIFRSQQIAEHSLPNQPTVESPSGVSIPQLRIVQRIRLEHAHAMKMKGKKIIRLKATQSRVQSVSTTSTK